MMKPNQPLQPPARPYRAIDGIRGLAALGVVLFHYTYDILPVTAPNPLKPVFQYGVYGVEVFFVLSGFVIPYSMKRSGYTWGYLGPFMLKRYLRIAPLAYISALLMILYHASAVWITGRPVATDDWPGVNPASILGNLLFHPEPFGTMWYNFVFWTLAFEFQFYLAIALLLPLLLQPGKELRNGAILIGILAMSPLFEGFFIRDSGYFFLGVSVFLLREGLLSRRGFWLLAAASVLAAAHKQEWEPLLLSVLATGALLWRPGMGSRFTDWLGDVSYPVYLLHMPVGYFGDSILKRVTGIQEHMWGRLVLTGVLLALAFGSAHLMHVLAERPLLRWLKRIRTGAGAPAA